MTSTRARLRLRPDTHGPALGLVAGMLVAAAAITVVGIRVRTVALDETLFHASALHYGSGLPDSLLHDPTARATSRLYALTLMPIFKLLDGDVALRVARAYNAALFCSAAVPAYLLARSVLRDRWWAVVAALLGVVTPWLIISTALYAESLAYAAFAWTVLACVTALRRPVWWHDVVAVGAIVISLGVRFQLGSLLVGYAVAAVLRCALDAREPAGDPGGSARTRVTDAGRRLARGFPALSLVGLAALAVLLVLGVTGQLDDKATALLGTYSEFDREGIGDIPAAVLIEVLALGLGLGVAPMVLALAWWPTALRRRAEDASTWWFAVGALCLTGALWAFTVYAQNGYIAARTEERYFFYPVGLVWIAAVAAVRAVPVAVERRTVLGGIAAFVGLAGTLALPRALTPDGGFLAPASTSSLRWLTELQRHLTDVVDRFVWTPRDLLFAGALIGGAALWVAWRRPRARVALGVVVPAGLQLGLLAYVGLATDGRAADALGSRVTGPPLAQSGWIDRAVGSDEVAWLQSEPRVDPARVAGLQLISTFFNDRITQRFAVRGAMEQADQTPLAVVPRVVGFVREGDGATNLRGVAVVQWVGSPLVQMAGTRQASSPDGLLELLSSVTAGRRLRWVAPGLGVDGGLPASGRPTRLDAWPEAPEQPTAVTLQLDAPAPAPAAGATGVTGPIGSLAAPVRASVRLGTLQTTVALDRGAAAQRVTAVVCGPHATGSAAAPPTRRADGTRVASARIVGVTLAPAAPGTKCPRR